MSRTRTASWMDDGVSRQSMFSLLMPAAATQMSKRPSLSPICWPSFHTWSCEPDKVSTVRHDRNNDTDLLGHINADVLKPGVPAGPLHAARELLRLVPYLAGRLGQVSAVDDAAPGLDERDGHLEAKAAVGPSDERDAVSERELLREYRRCDACGARLDRLWGQRRLGRSERTASLALERGFDADRAIARLRASRTVVDTQCSLSHFAENLRDVKCAVSYKPTSLKSIAPATVLNMRLRKAERPTWVPSRTHRQARRVTVHDHKGCPTSLEAPLEVMSSIECAET